MVSLTAPPEAPPGAVHALSVLCIFVVNQKENELLKTTIKRKRYQHVSDGQMMIVYSKPFRNDGLEAK